MIYNLPIVEKLVLQGMIKLILVKINASGDNFKDGLPAYDLVNYIVKPIATDLDIVLKSVCL